MYIQISETAKICIKGDFDLVSGQFLGYFSVAYEKGLFQLPKRVLVSTVFTACTDG